MATITGDDTSNSLVGTDLADNITAKGGNDTINGMGGGDDLRGGLGDDTYEFSGNFSPSGSFDRIWELAGEGSDTIHILSDIPASSVRIVGRSVYFDGDSVQIIAGSYGTIHLNSQLAEAKVEWLQLGDSAPISLTGGLTMTGDSSIEEIKGTKFNDTINGMGGGDDLRGGLGDDTYEFSGNFSPSGSFDRIWELAGEGSDTIHILSDIPASSVRIVGRSVYLMAITSKSLPMGMARYT